MNAKFFPSLTGMAALLLCALLANGCASNKNSAGGACCTMTKAAAETPKAVEPVKVTLKFVKVDSEETAGENGAGANAVDGDNATFWHTAWEGAPGPHEIVIELTPPATIKGFTYLPRQDDSDHGNIKDYEIYVSNDGVNFGQPVAKGSFESGTELKSATFAPAKCQFIKLKALSEINGEAWASAAEIGVIPAN